MAQLPYQYVTSSILVTVHPNGIEWMEKGIITGGKKQFVPASEIAGVEEDSGGLISSATLEIRFKTREPLALKAPLGSRGELSKLKDAVLAIVG